ncbi:MAG: hypothetical protein WDN28_07400 [Chthoniobacter sp.]
MTCRCPTGSQPLTVRKPDGKEVPVAAGAKFADTDQPGIYTVSPGTQRFVVNLAPDESRVGPFSRRAIDRPRGAVAHGP